MINEEEGSRRSSEVRRTAIPMQDLDEDGRLRGVVRPMKIPTKPGRDFQNWGPGDSRVATGSPTSL